MTLDHVSADVPSAFLVIDTVRAGVPQRGLRTTSMLERGSVIAHIDRSRRVAEPTRYTVQKSAGVHLSLEPAFVRFVNHGCEPNVFFDVDAMVVLALRAIRADEELSYFYPSTEWDMVEPFDCACGAATCLGRITGARAMPVEVLRRYRLSSFVRSSARLSQDTP